MTTFMKYLLTIGFLSIFLVACGTNTDTTNSVKDTTNENEIEQTVEETEQEVKESVEEKSPATEIKLTYSYNGNSVEETAHWIKSDNQAFGLYVLPTYELTAEEPQKDQIFFKEDDSHYMRIEILPGDSDRNALKETTLSQLQAVNEDVQTLSPEANDIQNATIMQAKKDNEIVTAYLIEQEYKFIKLTIFTNEQENHQDAFVQMAKNLKVD